MTSGAGGVLLGRLSGEGFEVSSAGSSASFLFAFGGVAVVAEGLQVVGVGVGSAFGDGDDVVGFELVGGSALSALGFACELLVVELLALCPVSASPLRLRLAQGVGWCWSQRPRRVAMLPHGQRLGGA